MSLWLPICLQLACSVDFPATIYTSFKKCRTITVPTTWWQHPCSKCQIKTVDDFIIAQSWTLKLISSRTIILFIEKLRPSFLIFILKFKWLFPGHTFINERESRLIKINESAHPVFYNIEFLKLRVVCYRIQCLECMKPVLFFHWFYIPGLAQRCF